MSIISYVVIKFLDQFLKEEGYGRVMRFLKIQITYKTELIKIIDETILEHEKSFPAKRINSKFPFYHSQVIFEELNKHVLFKTQYSDHSVLNHELQRNPQILVPSQEELLNFYNILVSKVNESKKLKNLFIEENYKSKIFDLEEVIIKIEKELKDIKEITTSIRSAIVFEPSKEWFVDQCNSAILDLGGRYTPELNFELDVSKIFEGIGRTVDFKVEATRLFDELLIKGKKILNTKAEEEKYIQPLRVLYTEWFDLFTSIDFTKNSKIPVEVLNGIFEKVTTAVDDLEKYYREEERKLQKEKNEYQFYHRYGYELRHIQEFSENLYDFDEFINGPICKLANNPFLILDGEAGIGKSHMLGDIISKRVKGGYESIFLLGQQFVTDDDPWVQILKKLQIKDSLESFLGKLNEKGKSNGNRVIIFIDAINEGRGKYFWNDNIGSFINSIRKYEWLGLVLSIRTSYKDLIMPEEEIKKLNLIEHTIYGFRNSEYEASKLFFTNYNIELPQVPLLHPEFQNPLFLKLFCEGIHKAGLNKIPDGLQGITSILNFFVKNVNKILSNPKRFNYSEASNLVSKSVMAIVQYKVSHKLRQVDYEKAIEIVEEAVSKYVTHRGKFLEELISEGIFSKNLFWDEEGKPSEGVYLSYERFEDHLTCQYLLEQYPNIADEFKKGGNLFAYVTDEHEIYLNKGLIDAFSIQIPEKTGQEFYHYVSHVSDKYSVVESFVDSLLWRKVETINEQSKEYVNSNVMSFPETQNLFWETILSITSVPNHMYNADSLHNHLMKFTLAERDADWTQRLKFKYSNDSSVKRLIDWSWDISDKSHISDESIRLSSIALAWFHTSTNRELRDCSTKAMINLLQNRIDVLIKILELFKDVNDPYVYERIFAVAYGCSLRTNDNRLLPELCECVYQLIFKNNDEIYPHVLLRDYARGIIEYSVTLGVKISFNIQEVRPPYKSKFPSVFPSNEEITKEYELDSKSKEFKDHHWGQNSILSSMATEHGRTMYGDFGRYTFQSALSAWKVSANDLSNLAIQWIFKNYGYDAELHGAFDRNIGTGRSRNSVPNERIGKKYQWIALHEMIARVSDNFPKYEEWGYNKKKEDPYQGPWSPSLRDIDPSVLLNKTGKVMEDSSKKFWWNPDNNFKWDLPHKDWINATEDLPSFENHLLVKDDQGEEWLILEGYPEWSETRKLGEKKWDYPHKRFWAHMNSFLVKKEDLDNLIKGLEKQSFMNHFMPQCPVRYEIFSREYYWSPAHKYFMTEYYEGTEWRDVYKHNEFIGSVIVPTEHYSWSHDIDKSKVETISYLKPSSTIYNGMALKYGDNEGEFIDGSQHLVCFAPNVNEDSKSFLCVKKKPFLKFLADQKLSVFWTVLGEKQVIGGNSFGIGFSGATIFNGVYSIFEKIKKESFYIETR